MITALKTSIQYVPYHDVGERPNIIVDGAPLASTLLTLSHWPVNNTPPALKRDTSTATVFAYLDTPELQVPIDIVSNNHFDEDGLFSMFALYRPEIALAHRELLLGGALAGDFGVYTDRNATRLCFVVESFADRATSPLPEDAFSGCERQTIAHLYRQMLDRLPGILEDLDGLESHWIEPEHHLSESESMIADGHVTIEEYPDQDLAIVHIPDDLPVRTVRRYLQPEPASIHPFAIQNSTACSRIVRVQGRRYDFYDRYESWVQFASRRPMLRVDMAGLASRLNEMDSAPGTWRAERATEVVPKLSLEGADESSLSSAQFIDAVRAHLATAPVAWDPFDWNPDSVEERKHA